MGAARTETTAVLARMIIALAVAAALSTESLVTTAEALPFGPTRTVLVIAAEAIDDRARAGGLHQPLRLVRRLTGRSGPDPAPPTTPVVIARARPNAETASPAPPRGPTTTRPAVAVTSTTSPVTTAPITARPRSISPEAKLRLWAGGDSLGEYVGNQLLHPIADPELVAVELDYYISTGLTRPDYFDWSAHLAAVAGSDVAPEAYIFMVGGNDDQAMEAGGRVLDAGTPAWFAEYERRAAEIADRVSSADHLFWIGLPPMRDDRRQEIAAEVDRILAAVADVRPWVTHVGVTDLLTVGDGYASHVTGPDGRRRQARSPDGVHMTYAASTWVADLVWAAVTDRWPSLETS